MNTPMPVKAAAKTPAHSAGSGQAKPEERPAVVQPTKSPAKPKQKPKPVGLGTLKGTPEARRQAALILEVLGGLRGPSDAAKAMGVALPRYYVLETRALQALIKAMEPLPRGPGRNPDAEIAALQRAQSIGNEILRPWGHTRPTRIEVWNSRQAIDDEQRTRLSELRDRCRENRLAELREAKLGPNRTVADAVRDQSISLEAALRPGAGGRSTPAPGSGQSVLETLSKHELASLERTALADALEQLGFLSYWRRQFTPPIKLAFRAKN